MSQAFPADIWCENNVVSTSMRRDHVASTLIQRHFGTKCPLGSFLQRYLEMARHDLDYVMDMRINIRGKQLFVKDTDPRDTTFLYLACLYKCLWADPNSHNCGLH